MMGERNYGKLLGALGLGLLGGWLLAGGAGSAGKVREPTAKSSPRNQQKWDRAHVPATALRQIEAVSEGGSQLDRMRATIELANSVPEGEIERWLDEHYFDSDDRHLKDTFNEILLGRLFEADPERFMQRGLRKDSPWLGKFMAYWTARDPSAAENFVISIQSEYPMWNLANHLGKELAKNNGKDGLARISEWLERAPKSGYHVGAIESLAAHHRELLLEHFESLPEEAMVVARYALANTGLSADFDQGVAWLEEQPNGGTLFGDLMQGSSEFRAALQERIADLPTGWIDRAIEKAGYALPREDPTWWLREDLASLGVSAQNVERVRRSAISALGRPEHREEAILVAAERELDSNLRAKLVENLLRSWDREDDVGAQAWLATLGDEDLRVNGLQQLEGRPPSNAVRRHRPEELIAWLGSESRDSVAYSSLERSAYWTAANLQEARRAFAELPAAERGRAAQTLASANSWTMNAPGLRADAMQHLFDESNGLAPRTEQAQIALLSQLSEHTSSWANYDSTAAAAWVAGLPTDGEAFHWASRNLLLTYSRLDPAGARRWVDNLPASVEREPLEEILEQP